MNIIYRYWASQYRYSNVLGQNSATSSPSLRIINARAHCSRHDSRRPRTFSNIVQLVHCAVLVFLDIPREDEPTRRHTPHAFQGFASASNRLKNKIYNGKEFLSRKLAEKRKQGRGERKAKGNRFENRRVFEFLSNVCRRSIYISSISTLVGKPRVHHFCIN